MISELFVYILFGVLNVLFLVIDHLNDNIREGSLVLVEFNGIKIFGYVTKKDKIMNNRKPTLYVTFESTASHLSDSLKIDMNIKITYITYIRAEILCFDAVFNLKKSILCDIILNPPLMTSLNSNHPNYTYKGHVS